MKFFVWILFMLFIQISFAQSGQYRHKTKKKQFYGNQNLREPLFRWVTGDYSRHGIHVGLGPNITLTRIEPETKSFVYNDTTTWFERNPQGRLGASIEVGMVHITKRPRKYIHYYDWAIGFKSIAGAETTKGEQYDQNDSLLFRSFGDADFRNNHLFGRFTVHNVYQFNPTLFLDNGLGVNLDYLLSPGNMAYNGFHIPERQRYDGDLKAQLHYELGLGFKPKDGFFIIPTFHLPVLGFHEWDNGRPNTRWFSSSYYPVHFKLKLVWLFKRDSSRCPPVEINEDDKKRANEFMNQ